jgi:hypothetical protein
MDNFEMKSTLILLGFKEPLGIGTSYGWILTRELLTIGKSYCLSFYSIDTNNTRLNSEILHLNASDLLDYLEKYHDT